MLDNLVNTFKYRDFSFGQCDYSESDMAVFSYLVNLHAGDLSEKDSDQIELFKSIIQMIRAFEHGFIMFEKNYVKSQVYSAVKRLAKKHGIDTADKEIIAAPEDVWARIMKKLMPENEYTSLLKQADKLEEETHGEIQDEWTGRSDRYDVKYVFHKRMLTYRRCPHNGYPVSLEDHCWKNDAHDGYDCFDDAVEKIMEEKYGSDKKDF